MSPTTSIESLDLPRVVARYAERFHTIAGSSHHVASPLGAWLLLALSAKGAAGAARAQLAAVLGAEPEVAFAHAARLLEKPHEALGTAFGVWTRTGLEAGRLAGFFATLPTSVERGGRIPTKHELDAWTRARTFGLIDEFPNTPDTRTAVLLAAALVTRVRWTESFKVVPAAELGERSAWTRRLTRVLRTPNDDDHEQFIAHTERAGDVAVHVVSAEEGVLVASVIAGRRVPVQNVVAAAHEIAIRVASRAQAQVSLYDLPLGDTDIWSITERQNEHSTGRESYSSILPAWEAHSQLDMLGRLLGFEEVAETIASLAGAPLERIEARQSAMARYTHSGFVAAAVSGWSGRLGRELAQRGVERFAQLRFGHPYAVVAVADMQRLGAASSAADAWHGVPLFSAWIAEPRDSEEEAEVIDDDMLFLDHDE